MSKKINLQDGKLHDLITKEVRPNAKVIYFDGTTEGAEKVANALYTEDINVKWDFHNYLSFSDGNGYGTIEEEISGAQFVVLSYGEDEEPQLDFFKTEDAILAKYNIV